MTKRQNRTAPTLIALGLLVLPAWAGPPEARGVPLIPRDVLFGNPDRAGPQISPDGKQLAFLAEVNGVMNVWVAPVDKPDAARAVTKDTKRGIRMYRWAYDNAHILYIQDKDGDENWHVYATNLRNNKTTDLTPIDGVQARIEEVSERFPDEILVLLNDRDKSLHDVYRVNIATAERRLIQKNTGFLGFVTDDDYNVRFASRMLPDGSMEVLKPQDDDWTLFTSIPAEDSLSTNFLGFDKSGKTLYIQDSRGRNTSGLFALNLATNEKKLLAGDDRADVGAVLRHPTEKTIQAVNCEYDRRRWIVIDPRIGSDLEFLKTVNPGDVLITTRSLDDKNWIVSYVVDDGPVRYYHYSRPDRKTRFLFTNRRKLEGLPLARMHPVVIKSRDGLNLVSYLTLPVWTDPKHSGRPNEPVPMVLLVHGGPWARDTWGLDGMHQWLANRGYAVLSVNFRGSTGLGKSFANAGNLEWAGRMHDDLVDAVQWAEKEKIADPKRVAIMGGSYGGYSTLVGVTFTPELFACGVDIVGPSNLITLLNSIPPYWKPMLDLFTTRVGDHRTDEGRKLLSERSPLTYVDRIQRPLLIGQGANDPRVKQAESDQIVKAMQDKKIPVTYILFSDEGHGFARPENRLAFNAVAEAFLARHLGGRSEPIGDDFKGSTIKAPQGADGVPGLADALKKM